jgi:hypothetical protein
MRMSVSLILSCVCVSLGASTRNVPWEDVDRDGNAVSQHSLVTQAYNIPHISIVDGFFPFDAETKRYWFLHLFRVDYCCHTTVLGHRMIAASLFKFIQVQICMGRNLVFQALQTLSNSSIGDLASLRAVPQPRLSLPAPIFVKPDDLKMYEGASPLYVPTTVNISSQYLVANQGFSLYADHAGKVGFIATTIGSSFELVFQPSMVAAHALAGVVKVQYLGSYAHMGTMQLTLTSLSPVYSSGSSPRCEALSVNGTDQMGVWLANGTVDTLWDARVSITASYQLRFATQQINASSTPTCLSLLVKLVESSPPRIENKIKILGVILF